MAALKNIAVVYNKFKKIGVEEENKVPLLKLVSEKLVLRKNHSGIKLVTFPRILNFQDKTFMITLSKSYGHN